MNYWMQQSMDSINLIQYSFCNSTQISDNCCLRFSTEVMLYLASYLSIQLHTCSIGFKTGTQRNNFVAFFIEPVLN